jgi:hypothetical protein
MLHFLYAKLHCLTNTPTCSGASRHHPQGALFGLLNYPNTSNDCKLLSNRIMQNYSLDTDAQFLEHHGVRFDNLYLYLLHEWSAEEHRNASEYLVNSVTWCMRSGALDAGLMKIKTYVGVRPDHKLKSDSYTLTVLTPRSRDLLEKLTGLPHTHSR